MNRTVLYVSGFSSQLRAKDLAYEFERYGRLVRCDIPALKTPQSAPFAFVEFRREDDAEEAYYDMHGRSIDGRRIAVQWAKRPPSAAWRHDGAPEPPRRDHGRDYGRDSGRDRDYGRDYDRRGPPPPRRRTPSPRRDRDPRDERDAPRDDRDRRERDYDQRRSVSPRRERDERDGARDAPRDARDEKAASLSPRPAERNGHAEDKEDERERRDD